MAWDINFLRFLVVRYPTGLYDHFLLNKGFRKYRQADLKREFSAFRAKVRAGELPRQLSLYVHVPFCTKLCTFCYCSRTKYSDDQEVAKYINRVDRQLSCMYSWLGHPMVDSAYFGGGSPSRLSEAALEKFFRLIFNRVSLVKNASIDFEAHPAELSLTKAMILQSFGLTRVSLGVQSLDSDVLKAINRSQSLGQVESAVSAIRESGIRSLNIDLVAGLPQQTVSSFINDVRAAVALGADNIHLTPFAEYGKKEKVGHEELLAFFRKRDKMTKEGRALIEEAGYKRYGFEAYAKSEEDGCRHEYNYLHAASVLGVGPYAKGILSGHLEYWIDPVGKNMSQWTFNACRTDKKYAMARFLIMHILKGLTTQEFEQVFTENLDVLFAEELSFLFESGIIARDGTTIRYNGDRSMKSLFEYFAFTRIFYGDAVLEDLRETFQKDYNPSHQYSFEKDAVVTMMVEHWFLQLYYEVGL